ncbi:hypothetical protein AOQ84DRAFT_352232 [Glonium stellatum]|uniref:T6SS Phospholipase effector Tle1-like catalytic domain-containing protein n=1 Tax=Glonium stellatum TaxID=574774 RepID=A0A8E2F9C4_9PEZI|nr:hypothetical protein AOQ84DRAFT_352232 [Glonium stellatum]
MATSQPTKRLIVCCDGTWLDSNTGLDISLNPLQQLSRELTGKITLQTPSNVTRICRAVNRLDTRGNSNVQQITYYQCGIGSQNTEDRIVGGATGYGLAEHIREAYQFIAANYNPAAHDEIYLIGFSRGAFTARSIASFINDIGLLTPTGMMHFYTIFTDWENQQKVGYKPPIANDPFPGPRPNIFSDGPKYVEKLVNAKMTTPHVKIKAVAVWETVGSLGLPRLGVFNSMNHESIDYAFVDTSVPPMVEHAIHAIALDEDRKPFMPTIWELPDPKPGQTLTQVWFAGAHADVGGSYDDTRAADITLIWMISQLQEYISFNEAVLGQELFSPQGNEPPIPWSCGPIHNELKGIFGEHGGGQLVRSPHEYVRYDHYTGLPYEPKQPLQKTYEKVHSSVRLRWALKGKTPSGGEYKSNALNGWQVSGTAPQPLQDGAKVSVEQIWEGQKNIQWRKPAPGGGYTVMQEDLMGELEWKLLASFAPSLEAKFLSAAPSTTGP